MSDTVPDGQPYVFISYASADHERVLPIAAALRDAGVTCWLDQHDIIGGSNWGGSIADAIQGCATLVLLASSASLASRNVRQEIALAWQHDKPYLPLLLDTTPVPNDIAYWLATAQWIEVLDHPVETWLPKAINALSPITIHRDSANTAVDPGAALRPLVSTFLPSPASSFVGREQEVAEIAALLHTERIVMLVGPGGVGKTRVAIAVGHRLTEEYANDVVFVDLTPLRDPALVLPTIAASAGVRESGEAPLVDALVMALRARQVLLILDNVEQIIEAAGDISRLVSACPSVTILATSREPLRISGESEYPIAPLLPPPRDREIDIERLRDNPTVALFILRARSGKPGFDLTAENAEAVVAICQRLDGLPLAIELAAARIRLLSPQALAQRIAQPLHVLTGGARDLPERQHTMRATIQWSYDALSDADQRHFRHLSVFVGGWTLESAEMVANVDGDLGLDVLDGLTSLHDKHLVRLDDQVHGEPRFNMLGTIREFGQEQLRAQHEDDVVRLRHATCFATFAEAFRAGYWGHEQGRWLQKMDDERENLRAAFETLMETREHERATALFVSLRTFWWDRGPLSEAQRWFDGLLPHLPSVPTALQAEGFNAAGILATSRYDTARARAYHDEALRLFRAVGDPAGVAAAIYGLSRVDLFTGDLEASRRTTAQALALFREIGDRSGVCGAACNLALLLSDDGDTDAALALLHESLNIAREDRLSTSQIVALSTLGMVEWERGNVREAAGWWRETLNVITVVNEVTRTAECFDGLAMVAAEGQFDRAAVLVGTANAIRERLQLPRTEREARRLDLALTSLRESRAPDALTTVMDRGKALPMQAAIAYALELASDEPTIPHPHQHVPHDVGRS